MKKKQVLISTLQTQSDMKRQVLNSLRKKLANTIDDPQVKSDAEALIAEKEAEIEAIKQLIADAEASEEDKSEELRAQIAELQGQVANLKQVTSNVTVKNFLANKKTMAQFRDVVMNSATGADFRASWGKVLVENGLSPADFFLPEAILGELTDLWETAAENFLSLLDVTGLKALKVAYDDNTGVSSRARGHQRGNAKNEEVIHLTPKEIRAQIVYKYITLDRETLDYEDTNGVLMRFVSRELAYRILHEIMRAVLVGDGRSSSDPDKISKIEAIFRTASDDYVTVSTAAAAQPTIEEVATAVDSIQAEGDITLFMGKQTLRALTKFVAATGGTVQYKSAADIAAELGVNEIRTTRLLGSNISGQPAVIAFVGKEYKIVGDLTMKGFENFILSYNKYEFLNELYVGGALAAPKSGAVVLRP